MVMELKEFQITQPQLNNIITELSEKYNIIRMSVPFMKDHGIIGVRKCLFFWFAVSTCFLEFREKNSNNYNLKINNLS